MVKNVRFSRIIKAFSIFSLRRILIFDNEGGIELLSDYDYMIEYHSGRANVVAAALSRKSQGRVNALYACRIPLLADLRSTGVKLGVEEKEEALLASFQVRSILIDRILDAQMNDEEIQELIHARNEGKKKDLRI